MKKNTEQALIKLIEDSLSQLGFTIQKEKLQLDYPTDERFGDLSTNIALKKSKTLKKPAVEIAKAIVETIRQGLEDSALKDCVNEVRVEGAGFINFYFKNKYFYEQFKDLVKKERDALKTDVGRGKQVLIEFVSANPTGPLSIAHARQAAVGDCLANLLDFLGFKVKREYYLNDEGNQIDILGKSVELRISELEGEKIEFPDNYYQGDYIYDVAKKAQASSLKPQDFGEFAANHILNIIKKELDDFGVGFDYWRSQKELRKSGKIEKALEFLKKKGGLYEKDGALWFKSTDSGDDKDRVVVKSDGSYTYLAPDIAYHQEKYQRGFKWLINLWGPDHHGYINRLKAAVTALGYTADSLSIIIVQLASIFKEGKLLEMSTRKGQYITLREVLDEVGKDASRFFFLMRRTSSHLDFDLDIAKKQGPENPVYYVQYAYARICSILRQNKKSLKADVDLSVLKEEEEIALIKKILQFGYILNICLSTLDPYMITAYLQELAEQFHKFYDSHRVLGDDESLTQGRLCLIRGVQTVFALGLELLGISKPEKM